MKLERVIQKPLACGLSGMIAVLACVAGAMLAPGCATAAWTFRALESNASGSYVDRMAMFAVGQASLRPWGHGNDAIQTAQGQIQRALVQDGTASSSGIMINISLHSAESAARRQLSILACLSDVLLVKAALRKVALAASPQPTKIHPSHQQRRLGLFEQSEPVQ